MSMVKIPARGYFVVKSCTSEGVLGLSVSVTALRLHWGMSVVGGPGAVVVGDGTHSILGRTSVRLFLLQLENIAADNDGNIFIRHVSDCYIKH